MSSCELLQGPKERTVSLSKVTGSSECACSSQLSLVQDALLTYKNNAQLLTQQMIEQEKECEIQRQKLFKLTIDYDRLELQNQNLNAQLLHAREENSQYIDLNSKLNEDSLKVGTLSLYHYRF